MDPRPILISVPFIYNLSSVTVEKDVSKENIKRSDNGLSVVRDTQLRNVKHSDDSPSFIGSAQRGMSYAEAMSMSLSMKLIRKR